MAVKIN